MGEIERRAADAFYWIDFTAFCYAAFEILNPGQRLTANWHIEAIGFHLQGMVEGKRPKKIVINLPPRTLKSLIVSVMLPAWLLGRDPTRRIICASYSEELAFKFSRDCRTLMTSAFFRRVFPNARLNPKKMTEREFETTRHGCRLATSVGGTLTGLGGDVLIIDDPTKANDAVSEVALNNAREWFFGTAFSRRDRPDEGLIILAMQRLHVNDLSGILIEKGWPSLVIPARAIEPDDYSIANKKLITVRWASCCSPIAIAASQLRR